MARAKKGGKILTHERFRRAPEPDPNYRELLAVREISHALAGSDRPEDVFQFALDRISPMLGASFASVYLVDDASELMSLTAAHKWPARFRPWLSDVRVRVGFGPSGEAAAERRLIEVPDVLGDPDLEDWAEVAGELGFKSLVAVPILAQNAVLGVVTFYFEETGNPTEERRSLMRTVADQLAGAAERARLLKELRRVSAALGDANSELDRQYRAVRDARRAREEFLANASDELRTPLSTFLGQIGMIQEDMSGSLKSEQREALNAAHRAGLHVQRLIDDLIELAEVRRLDASPPVSIDDFDPGGPLRDAVTHVGPREGFTLRVADPPALPPRVRSDSGKFTRILIGILRNVFDLAEGGIVEAGYMVGPDRIVYQIRADSIEVHERGTSNLFEEFRSQRPASAMTSEPGSGLGLALARQLARLLGGDIQISTDSGHGATFTAELPMEYDPSQRRF
ncbi:MAG: GAF domain-containing sensor histidine kinase [Gemmatimonadota bacterium]